MKTPSIVVFLWAALAAVPASAQVQRPPIRPVVTPSVSLRPFLMVAGQRFAARETFQAVFGQSFQPSWGGGLNVAFRNGLYIDVAASRFRKEGERAFFFEGEGYPLGIPLTATLTPLEVSVGGRSQVSPRVFPYFGVGVGSYAYTETSEFDDEPFDKRRVGYLVVLGVEFRVSRWVAVSGDAQYTHVPGIIGSGGVSKEADESNLGGIAGRFRVIVGR